MRILFIDIDTLRPDHLGCYGYPRDTSPHIDRIAAQGVRFTGCYASDVPCLPSRMALHTGRFGIHNGIVGHGGAGAELTPEGGSRGFSSRVARESLAARMRRAGFHTATLSAFAERHSAFAWYAGFNEHAMVPKRGLEGADEVSALASDWLTRWGARDRWFLHLHLWDPHTPYRAPASFGDPFGGAPLPAWLTEEVRAGHYTGVGPHSAREAVGFSTDYPYGDYPRQPREIPNMAAVRQMFDGYDTGIRFADEHLGRLFNQLEDLGVLDETVIVITSDHGENLGELNVYGDHHTADEHTAHIPMIVRVPGVTPRVDEGFYYQFDVAATLLELAGGEVPAGWDACPFTEEFGRGVSAGRDHLILSQAAWACQRAVRFDRFIAIRTYHDAYHGYPDTMLFDLVEDPHEQRDLAHERPELLTRAWSYLDSWYQDAVFGDPERDPLMRVVREGGGFHVRGQLPAYLERLRATGRVAWAERLAQRYADELR